MTKDQRNKLAALRTLLEGYPPYPVGTGVRQMQDELAELEAMEAKEEDRNDRGN